MDDSPLVPLYPTSTHQHIARIQQCSVTLPTHKQQDAQAPRLYVHAQGLHGQRCLAYDTDKRHVSAPDPTSAAPTSVTAVRDSHEWCVHWSMCVCTPCGYMCVHSPAAVAPGQAAAVSHMQCATQAQHALERLSTLQECWQVNYKPACTG
jgi:hypothetical protein